MPRKKGQKVRTKEETKNIIIALEEFIIANGETTLKQLLDGPGKDLGLSSKKGSDKITIPKWLKRSDRVEWKKKGRALIFFPPEKPEEAPEGGEEAAADGYTTLPVVAVPDDMNNQIAEIAKEHEVSFNDTVQVLLHFGLLGFQSTLKNHAASYTLEHGMGREFTETDSLRFFVHTVKGLYPLYAENASEADE